MDVNINNLLLEELEKEPDEIIKKICKLTIELAQKASNDGEPNIAESVSNKLEVKLTKLCKDSDT